MPSLTSYKGLQVLTPDPTGAGGLAIQNDFKQLVDWQPKSVWSQSADPTAGDDENDDFFPGSCWLRTNTTPPKLFVCQSSAVGAALWRQVLLELAQDATPELGANLDGGGFRITNLADPANPQEAATKAYVDANAGAGTQGSDGSGTNAAGTSTVISPGQSTGNATPARTVIQSTLAGASGTSLQSLFPCLTVGAGSVQMQNSAGTAVLDIDSTGFIRSGNASTGPGKLRLEGNGGSTSFFQLQWSGGTGWDFKIGANTPIQLHSAFVQFQDGHVLSFGATNGNKIGGSTTQKLGFWNATPVVQQVLATGAGHTVDDVISLLQTIGLCRQS